VDRAALDAALALGIPCGGWCPNGRLAEDGCLEQRYPLTETPSADYAQRTDWNVGDSVATLILTRGTPTGGTAYTIACARRRGKPCLVVDLDHEPHVNHVRRWLRDTGAHVLNVAGPRESTTPGIYADALAFLRLLLPENVCRK